MVSLGHRFRGGRFIDERTTGVGTPELARGGRDRRAAGRRRIVPGVQSGAFHPVAGRDRRFLGTRPRRLRARLAVPGVHRRPARRHRDRDDRLLLAGLGPHPARARDQRPRPPGRDRRPAPRVAAGDRDDPRGDRRAPAGPRLPDAAGQAGADRGVPRGQRGAAHRGRGADPQAGRVRGARGSRRRRARGAHGPSRRPDRGDACRVRRRRDRPGAHRRGAVGRPRGEAPAAHRGADRRLAESSRCCPGSAAPAPRSGRACSRSSPTRTPPGSASCSRRR